MAKRKPPAPKSKAKAVPKPKVDPPIDLEVDPRFTIVKDTREQQGWTFRASEHFQGMVLGTLRSGDYALLGYEDMLIIERKASVSEIAGNLKEARFERELMRLEQEVAHPYIILEFDLQDVFDWPRSSDIPYSIRRKIKTTGPYLAKRITELMFAYPKVHWIFCGTEGPKLALALLKKAAEDIRRV